MLKNSDYQLNTVVELKKPHPSGTVEWIVVRLGADIKIKSSIKPGLFIMMTRVDFNKKVKKVIKF